MTTACPPPHDSRFFEAWDLQTKQWYLRGLPAKNDGFVSSSFLLF